MSVAPMIPNDHDAIPEGWVNYRAFAATIKDHDPEVKELAGFAGGFRDAWIHCSLSIVIGYKYNVVSSDYEVHYVILTDIDENGGHRYEEHPLKIPDGTPDGSVLKFVTDWQASRRCIQDMMIINNLAKKHC